MNQIATNQAYSMLVTEEDISKAMYVLSALPARVQSDRKLFKEVYFRALHGVSPQLGNGRPEHHSGSFRVAAWLHAFAARASPRVRTSYETDPRQHGLRP